MMFTTAFMAATLCLNLVAFASADDTLANVVCLDQARWDAKQTWGRDNDFVYCAPESRVGPIKVRTYKAGFKVFKGMKAAHVATAGDPTLGTVDGKPWWAGPLHNAKNYQTGSKGQSGSGTTAISLADMGKVVTFYAQKDLKYMQLSLQAGSTETKRTLEEVVNWARAEDGLGESAEAKYLSTSVSETLTRINGAQINPSAASFSAPPLAQRNEVWVSEAGKSAMSVQVAIGIAFGLFKPKTHEFKDGDDGALQRYSMYPCDLVALTAVCAFFKEKHPEITGITSAFVPQQLSAEIIDCRSHEDYRVGEAKAVVFDKTKELKDDKMAKQILKNSARPWKTKAQKVIRDARDATLKKMEAMNAANEANPKFVKTIGL